VCLQYGFHTSSYAENRGKSSTRNWARSADRFSVTTGKNFRDKTQNFMDRHKNLATMAKCNEAGTIRFGHCAH